MEPDGRTCTKCDEFKPLDDFSKAPKGKYGRKANCKACDNARFRAGYTPADPKDTKAKIAATIAKKREGPKTCTKCGESKPRSEFSPARHTENGTVLKPSCKVCAAAAASKWYHDNPERANAQKRRRQMERYGLTQAAYDQMVQEQGGTCAICRKIENGSWSDRLSIDHCHETDAVRGLLCNTCNRGIGLLGDDPQILRKAISYLLRDRG